MNTKELLNGLSTDALDTVGKAMASAELSEDALTTYVWLARLEKWAKVFRSLQAAQPKLKAWQPVPFAVLRIQPDKTVYTYPQEILDLEAKVRAEKEAAKAAGTAKSETSSPDPDTDQLFKVSLTEC
jgi:hypothetical protein